MFYEGTLQEGISSAVGQQKLVLCFVTDDAEESQIWENEYLGDESLRRLIQNQAVALRLMAGSEEAGYLAQIFPLPQTPTIVIMKHGELKEYISAGTSKEDFFRRLQSAFNVTPSATAAVSSSSSSSLANGLAAFVPMRRSPSPHVAADAQTTTSPLPDDGRSEAVNRVLAERVARLKAEKEEAERKAKEEKAKAKEERAKAAERAMAADPGKARQAEQAKKMRKQQEDERKRILRNIDADKEERRLRANAREQKRIDNQQVGDVASALTSSPQTALPSVTRLSDIASLQVRLFDGSTIRSRFKTTSALSEVRRWVDENKGENKLPYTFKQVLTPLPNKNIDETEESKQLGELGLVPSATLVLIPVQRYSSAYDKGSRGGFGLFGFFALILSLFSWLGGLLHIFTGRGVTQDGSGSTQPHNEAASSARNANNRARDLRNMADRQRDHQLYNGNSLNFEPRPDEDDAM